MRSADSPPASWSGARLYTIGHSTRSLDELVASLRSFGVSLLADVRTIPRSRHNPQFDAAVLPGALHAQGIAYVHLPRLGGLRRARKDSPNTGWRNASFRGFADYMATEEFEAGLAELRALSGKAVVALMCAEAVPWRCHRSLLADVLTARGARVEHIAGPSRATPHHVTSFARVEGGRVSYPGADATGGALATAAPFHLEATVRVLQRRPTNRVDVWREGHYVRAFHTAEGVQPFAVENRGTIDAPDLRYAVRSGDPSLETQREIVRALRRVLGLDVEPAPLQRLAEEERALRPTAMALRGMRPPRFPSLFEALANVVPFQQVSLDAGAAIVARLVERFGQASTRDGAPLYAFPSAEAIAEARLDALRRCGLSTRKAESLRRLARAIASKELVEEELAGLSTPEAARALTELPGIGPWSAHLVLLRGLGRIDAFPPGDVGAARGLARLLGRPPGASLERVVERFGDRRGYLYFCSLGGSLLEKGLIHPAPPPVA